MLKKILSGNLLFVSFLAILSTANAMDNNIVENTNKDNVETRQNGPKIKTDNNRYIEPIYPNNEFYLQDNVFAQGKVLLSNRNDFLIEPRSISLLFRDEQDKKGMQAIEIFKYGWKTNCLLSLLRPHKKYPGQENERQVVPFLETKYLDLYGNPYSASLFLEWMLDNPLTINVILQDPEYEVIRTELKRHLIDKVLIKNRRHLNEFSLVQHKPLSYAWDKSKDSPYLRSKAIRILKSLDFTLSELHLQHDNGSIYQFICDSLKSTDSVHTLVIDIGEWPKESIQNIFKGGESFPNLKSFGIIGGYRTPSDIWDDLYNSIKSKPTIEELDIDASIGNEECEPISKILGIRPLTSLKLNLSGRAVLGSEFFQHLIPFFTNNSSLRTLKIDYIEDHNASLLINALKDNFTLTNLSLYTNSTSTGYYDDQNKFCVVPVNTKLADDILVFLNHNTSLKSLTLSSYEVDSYPSNKLKELAQAIQKHPTLTHISLNEQVFERENSMPFSCTLNLKWDPESKKVIKNIFEVPEWWSNLKHFKIIEQFSTNSELWVDVYNIISSNENIERFHIEYDRDSIYKKNEIIKKITNISHISTVEKKEYDRYK
ncbi:MAG: hypothetical protein KBD76_13425 [Bacteriovorax sp.]|nr:hypothetical protein [Bacteriovorax sp.]